MLNIEAQDLGEFNTSQNLKTLIDSGSTLIDVGSYDDANRTLSNAQVRLAQWQSELDGMNMTAQLAQNASLVVGNASEMVNQNLVAWQGAKLDTQDIQDKLAMAQSLVASEPEQAQALALQVEAMAKLENDKLASGSSVYGWIGLAVGAVAIVGIAAWMLVRSRQKDKKNGL